jgi:hypothetical protein
MDPDADPGGPKHMDPTDPDADPQHCLQELLLLRILLQRQEELAGLRLLGINQRAEPLKNKHRGEMIGGRVAGQRLYAAAHKGARLLLRAGGEVLQQAQQPLLRLLHQPGPRVADPH